MVSHFAIEALTAAYGKEAAPSAIEQWTKAGLLEDDVLLRRLGAFDEDATAAVVSAGINAPLTILPRLAKFIPTYVDTVAVRKRQRTAVASNKNDLAEVLVDLKISTGFDLKFEPRLGFAKPSREAVDDIVNSVHRSLYTGSHEVIVLPPEQTAREFIYQVKPFLPDHHLSEVRLPSADIKRPDVFVGSADKLRTGLVELKKTLSQRELELALAQVAVYAACWVASLEDAVGSSVVADGMRFVILSGLTEGSSVLVRARAGICCYAKDREGEFFVERVRYESGACLSVSPLSPGKKGLLYGYSFFIKVIERLYWVGGAGGGATVRVSGHLALDDEEDKT